MQYDLETAYNILSEPYFKTLRVSDKIATNVIYINMAILDYNADIDYLYRS